MSPYELIRALLRGLGSTPARVAQSLFQLGVAAVLLLLVVGAVGLEFSSRPRFCVTCHYMRPYYKSWQESSHRHVRCIDCHFPPGLNFELQRKFQALVQVVKYVTRQYGTRPWTQIEDSSCLRPGCHQTRLLAGKVEFKGVQFDHLPHLSQFRRVTRLRCTSCHSQLVQGQHMTVTEGTCFLCHFKHGSGGEEPSDCQTCHRFPIGTKDGSFSHEFVEKRGVDCQECHANVVHGQGEVPRDRCRLCHAEPERVERYSDVAFVHANHVTERKIECAQCHNAVEHQTPAEDERLTSERSGLCGKCHHQEHDPVALLYAGRGAEHVSGAPAAMYTAQVTCEACHRTYTTSQGAPQAHAGAGGCMLCHGEKYGADLARWRAEFGAPVAELSAALRKARDLIAAVPPQTFGRRPAWYLVDRAVRNVEFVREARGLHNPQYSRRILGTAALEANHALRLVGLSYRVPQPAAAAAMVGEECTTCHTRTPAPTMTVYGLRFDHERHATQANVACSFCHTAALPEESNHGRLRLGPQGCRTCHAGRVASPHASGWRESHGGRRRREAQACEVCHDSGSCLRCHGLTMPHPRNWAATHGLSALRDSGACRRCHQESMCTSCHGLRLPHPANWEQARHGLAYRNSPALCQRCHQGPDCARCHQLAMPHPAGWLSRHGTAAAATPAACSKCHHQSECESCHQKSPPASHGPAWSSQHPQAARSQSALCALCHSASKGDTCLTCHGLPMPHPDDFALKHAEIASFEKTVVCFRCHELKKTCGECHEVAAN